MLGSLDSKEKAGKVQPQAELAKPTPNDRDLCFASLSVARSLSDSQLGAM